MVTLIVIGIVVGGYYMATKAVKKAAANSEVVSGIGSIFWKWLKK